MDPNLKTYTSKPCPNCGYTDHAGSDSVVCPNGGDLCDRDDIYKFE